MENIKEFIRSLVVRILTAEARAVISKYRPQVILVTGSVGKTSSKDAVYTALASSFFIRRSEKSFNSDIGVPLTVLGVPNGWGNPVQWLKNILEGLSLILLQAPYPKWLVLEIGADRPGDITRSLSWIKPAVVLGTRFPAVPVHVEFYDSPEEVIKEESAPLTWLTVGGTAVLNADDERARFVSLAEGVTKITYGFEHDADVRGTRYLVTSTKKMPTGIAFDVQYNGEKAHVSVPGVIGKTHAQAVLAGIATAVAVGVPLQTAAQAFESHVPPAGRTRIVPGLRGTTIIDDTYNSSPVASEEALKILAEAPRTGRRIAVLADMLELGSFSVTEHTRIGTLVATCADILVTTGVRARDTARGARDAGMHPEVVLETDRAADAASAIVSIMSEGDIILVKGSQSMRMERVVKSLMLEPAKAKDLLVRHDAEWLARP
jgi:UDP-N-acetylmuramoyl-tripeptide--D-alanyl-D-alanine ligase